MSLKTLALRSEVYKIAKFGIVGVVATAIHTGVALLALSRFGSPFAANVAGFVAAFGVSLTGQALWTFGVRTDLRRASARYFAVALLSFLVSNLALGAATSSGLLPDWIALLVAIAVVPVCNFLAARFWAFRQI